VVCTLTAELRHLFLRIGITPLALGAADPDALGQDVGRWGSYYDHHPVVLGRGKPFIAGPQPPLRLTKSQEIGERSIRLTYVPA
jgi:hypothetical protein